MNKPGFNLDGDPSAGDEPHNTDVQLARTTAPGLEVHAPTDEGLTKQPSRRKSTLDKLSALDQELGLSE